MDVFGKGTDEPSRPLLPPGTCWICSNSPQQEAVKVIDTRRNTQAGGSLSHASVRIYVCEPCVKELGEAMGMVSAEKYEAVATESTRHSFDLAAMHDRLQVVESEQVKVVDPSLFLEQLRKELDAVRVKPTPKPRAAAAK